MVCLSLAGYWHGTTVINSKKWVVGADPTNFTAPLVLVVLGGWASLVNILSRSRRSYQKVSIISKGLRAVTRGTSKWSSAYVEF